jgi:hypothetical protein
MWCFGGRGCLRCRPYLDYVASNGRMIDELEGIQKEKLMAWYECREEDRTVRPLAKIWYLLPAKEGTGVVTGYRLDLRGVGVSSPGRVKNFLFSLPSRPTLGSTQPSVQWVPGALSPGVKAARS